MSGIIGLIALLTVLGLSLVITRIAAIALSMTGLSHQAAVFQARSAFTGTGFTTSESEKIVNHPVRRRIIMGLMILRSAGLVTVVISIILSFVGETQEMRRMVRLLWLIGGVAMLFFFSHLPIVNVSLEKLIRWALNRWTDLDVRDYARLLKLSGEYTVNEMHVSQDDWVQGKKLSECRLDPEGLTVLGIQRENGNYVGAPHGNTQVHAGDTLILYGRTDALADLDKRQAGGEGEAAHQQAVEKQKQHVEKQEQQERCQEQQRIRDSKPEY